MIAADLWQYETIYNKEGFLSICGVDEAGRGPLCGPVFAAAVILPLGIEIKGLDDSKKLTAKRREALFGEITRCARAFCVASASEREIDEINILNATFLAIKRAIDGLSVPADFVLVDGNLVRGITQPAKAIVKGDSLSASIAAASILAKVSRDRYMCELSKDYPQYELERHKGYPTRRHIELVREFGANEIYRKSFLKKII